MVKSAYFHIPFCKNICSYCDFCKMFYNQEKVHEYLKQLSLEFKNNYKNEVLDTIYIGGGTPSSLKINELEQLFLIIDSISLSNNYEFTFECNIEDITKELALFLIKHRVNRISVGVETFQEKYLLFLNRKHKKDDTVNKINLLKSVGFSNISIDLMYAFSNETIEEVESDIDLFLSLDIPHVSTYSLIIEDNTLLKINGVEQENEDIDREMYDVIRKKLESHGYIQYETSNFSKDGYQSKHNLVYWNNQVYYGFGLGASGYLGNIRYTNTRSMNHYIEGNYLLEKHELSKEEEMSNEMILGLRKMEGVSKRVFFEKFQTSIFDCYDIMDLLEKHLLVENEEFIFIPREHSYVANEILLRFM